jgi:hypothetical protein
MSKRQHTAVDQFRRLARSARYRVSIDPEGFPVILLGRYGLIEWFDGRDLAVYSDHPRLFAKMWAIPGVRRHQTGDQAMRAIFPPEALEQVAGGHPGPPATPGGVRGPPPEGCVIMRAPVTRPSASPLQSDFPAAGGRLVPGAASLVGSGRSWLPGAGRDAKLRRLPRGPATRDRGRQRAGIGRR